MNKKVELKDNNYLSTEYIVHGRKKLSKILNDTPKWQTLQTATNWGAYPNEIFNTPSFFKRNNQVIFKGVLQKNSAFVGDETIATLPEGYRPKKRILLQVLVGSTEMQRIDIHTNGEIRMPAIVANAQMVVLEGVSFFID